MAPVGKYDGLRSCLIDGTNNTSRFSRVIEYYDGDRMVTKEAATLGKNQSKTFQIWLNDYYGK